jgi:hypothetical protein
MSQPFDWRATLYRWRRWLIAAAIIILTRVLLPIVLQRVIASQASKALNASVQVGDVDLGIFKGFVALKDVAVRANAAPPDSPPLIGWKLFAVDLGWLALFSKTIRLEEVILDTPHVSLERLQNGDLNLMAFVPKSSGAPPPVVTPAEAPAKPGWAFGVDRFVLRAGGVHFQDLMMTDSKPLEIGLPTIEATDIEIRPGLYGQPARALIEMKVDDGVLKIDASATMRDDGVGVETKIKAEHLPLRRSRVYIPKVGWSDLRGTMSMDLVHRIDTNGSRHDLQGWVGLHDLVVRVPGFEDDALTWHVLTVHIAPVDLVEQRVTVAQVELDGLTLPVRTGGGEPFPVLRALMAKPAAEPSGPTPTTEATAGTGTPLPTQSIASATPTPTMTPGQDAPTLEAKSAPRSDTAAAATPPAKPWHWLLTEAHLTNSTLHVLHNTGRMDVGVAAEVHDLAGEGDQPGAIKLGLTIGQGSLNVDGKLRLTPIGFGGHIVIDKLNVPDVVTASSAVAPAIVPAARLALDLNVDTGSLAPTPGDLNVTGTIALADAQVAPPAPKGMTVGLRSLTVGFDPLHLVGLLAAEPSPNRGDLDLHGKITLADLQVAQLNRPAVGMQSLEVGFDELHVAGLLAPAGPNQGDVRLKGKISVGGPRVTAPGAKEPAVSVKTIDLALDELNAPALLAKVAAENQGPAPGNITVRGKLNIVEPRAGAANAKEFSAAVKSIDVAVDEVLVPNPKNPKPGPLRVNLGDIRITQPSVQVTRTKDGIVLPQLEAANVPTSQKPAPSPAAVSPASPPGIDLSIASLQVSKGRVAFTDRVVKPFFAGTISPLDVELKGVRYPERAASKVSVDATVAPSGKITATGNMGPSGGTVDLKVEEMALAPFNPYATAYSPYGIEDGSLTVATKASFTPGGYKSDTSILLHDLEVSGAEGDSLFQQNFGIPLTVALALLKDMSGNISLDVPLEADREGTKVGLTSIVAGALRSALVGALASPLKLVGMALPGGKEKAAAPPEIAFRPGRADPTVESEGRIKQLAGFISSRPGMGVTLEPIPSTRDVRWLREHALLEELGKPQGIFGAVKNLGEGGKRERIRKALAARENDETGDLSDDDAKTLDEWLDERPSPTQEQLHALADARLTKLESVLHDDYGVDASRIARSAETAEPTDDAPVVRLKVGVVQK